MHAEQDGLTDTAKTIIDLDALLSSLAQAISPSRPWQRQLLTRLAQAANDVQVLRMSIAMDRGHEELAQAAAELHATLSAECCVQ